MSRRRRPQQAASSASDAFSVDNNNIDDPFNEDAFNPEFLATLERGVEENESSLAAEHWDTLIDLVLTAALSGTIWFICQEHSWTLLYWFPWWLLWRFCPSMFILSWQDLIYCSWGCTLLPIYVCWAMPPHDWHWLLRALAAIGLGLLVTCWCTLIANHLSRARAIMVNEDKTALKQCAAIIDSGENSDDGVSDGDGAEQEEEACTREELHSLIAELEGRKASHPNGQDASLRPPERASDERSVARRGSQQYTE